MKTKNDSACRTKRSCPRASKPFAGDSARRSYKHLWNRHKLNATSQQTLHSARNADYAEIHIYCFCRSPWRHLLMRKHAASLT